MDTRGYGGHFKLHAFIWRPSFGQRQARAYPSENISLVETVSLIGGIRPSPPVRSTASVVTTQEIINAIIRYRCSDDIDRYLHRNLQIERFLGAADINVLRQQDVSAAVLRPKALIDDRNNETVTRNHPNGTFRPNQGPLNARELFACLSQEV